MPDLSSFHLKATGLNQYNSEGQLIFARPLDRLWETMTKYLGFTYSLKWPQPNEFYGQELPNGSWTGMIGMARREEIDIVLGFMIMTPERAKIIEYSRTLVVVNMAILSGQKRVEDRTSDVLVNVSKLGIQVWLGIFLAGLLVSIILDFPRNINSSSPCSFCKHIFFRACKNVFLMFGILLDKGPNVAITAISEYIVYPCYLFGVMLVVALMDCEFSTNLIVSDKPVFLDSREQLASSITTQPITLGDSSFETVLRKSEYGPYAEIYRRIQKGDGRFISVMDAFGNPYIWSNIASGKMAYIQSLPAITGTGNMVCNFQPNDTMLHISQEQFYFSPTGVGFRMGLDDEVKSAINYVILRLDESGIFRYWYDEFPSMDKRCFGPEISQTELKAFKLESMTLLLIVIAVGYLLSVITFICEKCWAKYHAKDILLPLTR